MSRASSWADVEQGLAEELGGLANRTFVTVAWSTVPTVYVQLEQTPDRLVARTGADDVLPEDRRLHAETRVALLRGGWVAPEQDPAGLRTWTLVVPWPARGADHARLAERCVAVLRHVHGVPSPEELEYRAWRDAEPDPVGVTFYPDDLEPAEPHLVLPALGLRDAQEE